jgi:hypothetical protein
MSMFYANILQNVSYVGSSPVHKKQCNLQVTVHETK